MDVTEAGMVIDVKLVAFANAKMPIVRSCEPEPNVTGVKLVQPLNAASPIYSTEAGMIIDVTPLQPLNAFMPIDVIVKPPNIPGIFNGPIYSFGKNPVKEPTSV